MTKSADLKEQLSNALPKRKSKSHSHGTRVKPRERKGVVRLSISLFPPDLERLDRIRAFMATLGVRRVGDSQALRLALRRAAVDADMLTIYNAMRAEDGRGGSGGRNA